MLSKKYIKEFIKKSNIVDITNILTKVTELEKSTNKEVLNWTETEICMFLKSFHAVSTNSLNKYLVILRKFGEYIAEKENLPQPEYKLQNTVMDDLIDKELLFASTLTYDQYREIKNQLSIIDEGEIVNVRDKLIFELAWSGLSNEEIKMLEENKIEFSENNHGQPIALLTLNTDRLVRIEDPEIVEDIKKCMREKYYIIRAKDGRRKQMSYKDSKYLIKPVSVGRTKKESNLDNPGTTLINVFINNDITCTGINMSNLNIEDIRRSKIIYLLSPDNQEYFDEEIIAALFNFKNKYALNWLKDIAAEIYNSEGDR